MDNKHISILALVLIACMSLPMSAQSLSQLLIGSIETRVSEVQARSLLLQGRIHEAVVSYSSCIEQAKENINGSKGVDPDLLAEYAYALALNQDYEPALLYIDRARALNAKYGNYYAGQILTVMGYEQTALEFLRTVIAPSWIAPSASMLNSRYALTPIINHDQPADALRRANSLVATNQHIQAVALYEELMATYPSAYVIPASYSTLWEQMGCYAKAAELLRRGIRLMPSDEASGSLQAYSQHLTGLEAKTSEGGGIRHIVGTGQGIMYYVGASAANDMFSLNFREGVYTNTRFSMAFNMGLSFGNDMMIGNLGLSMYKTWNWFMGGFSVDDQFSINFSDKSSSSKHNWSISPIVGLSFLSKSGNSSFDITYGFALPFSSDGMIRSSFSIGQTFYFDIKGKKK